MLEANEERLFQCPGDSDCAVECWRLLSDEVLVVLLMGSNDFAHCGWCCVKILVGVVAAVKCDCCRPEEMEVGDSVSCRYLLTEVGVYIGSFPRGVVMR